MNKVLVSLLLTFMLSNAVAQNLTRYEISAQFIDHLMHQRYSEAMDMCNDRMRYKMDELELRDLWPSLEERFGAFIDTSDRFIQEYENKYIVFTKSNFLKQPLYLKVTIDSAFNVAGFFVQPAPRDDQWIAPKYISYATTKSYRTKLVSGKYELDAELTLPKTIGPFPTVILVHGSGPQDKDESNGPNKPFKDIALGLAARGVAVFRYDKRSYTYGEQMSEDEVTIQNIVTDDVISAVKAVKQFKEVDTNNIYVAGHSLGGMMAPYIADNSDEIAGILMLAAPSRSMLDMIEIQLGNMLKKHKQKGEKEAVEGIEEIIERVQFANSDQLNKETSTSELPYNIPASFWLSLKPYDQLTTTKKLDCPIYILHANADQQVFKKDFELWKKEVKSKPNVELKSYDGLNHMFIESKFDDVQKDYAQQGNVEESVIEDMEVWIKKQVKR